MAIANQLLALGFSVLDLAPIGKGAPDMLVGYQGDDRLVELKTEKGVVEKHQAAWHQTWRGRPVVIARTLDDVLTALNYPLRRSVGSARTTELPPSNPKYWDYDVPPKKK